MIFRMEKKHAARVQERFGEELGDKPLIVLRIRDEYPMMDPTLINLLKSELSVHLNV